MSGRKDGTDARDAADGTDEVGSGAMGCSYPRDSLEDLLFPGVCLGASLIPGVCAGLV